MSARLQTSSSTSTNGLSFWIACRRKARRFWRGFREWCGDAAYERYLRSSARREARLKPLSAKDFYIDQLNRRYSRPNRCC
jgi:uncharacterized short protein YbdD (DUF466 family)